MVLAQWKLLSFVTRTQVSQLSDLLSVTLVRCIAPSLLAGTGNPTFVAEENTNYKFNWVTAQGCPTNVNFGGGGGGGIMSNKNEAVIKLIS